MYARAGEPKKLVVLKGFGHYEVYGATPSARRWRIRWRGTGRIYRHGAKRCRMTYGFVSRFSLPWISFRIIVLGMRRALAKELFHRVIRREGVQNV